MAGLLLRGSAVRVATSAVSRDESMELSSRALLLMVIDNREPDTDGGEKLTPRNLRTATPAHSADPLAEAA